MIDTIGSIIPNQATSTLNSKLNSLTALINSNKRDKVSENESITPLNQPTKGQPINGQSIDKAASEFEELFVSSLLKQMRETLEEGLFGKETSDSLGAMFDLFMGKHLAESKPLGIGQAVKSYLKAEQTSE